MPLCPLRLRTSVAQMQSFPMRRSPLPPRPETAPSVVLVDAAVTGGLAWLPVLTRRIWLTLVEIGAAATGEAAAIATTTGEATRQLRAARGATAMVRTPLAGTQP